MIKTHGLLKKVLIDIDESIRDGINAAAAAKKHAVSERHLQRLFKSAFNQPLGSYIRSRKLSASVDDLLNTNLNVLDIALDYGFEYEHTYIRAFKRKFGITPGNLRKTRQISHFQNPVSLGNGSNDKNFKNVRKCL
jgi:AraC family transcriptional regulator